MTTGIKLIAVKYFCTKTVDKKLLKDTERHERKFRSLEREFGKISAITKNPNTIVTNLIGDPDPQGRTRAELLS